MQAETELATHTSPEQQELEAKRRDLAVLVSELTDRELSLADLKAELANFEGKYLREVGVLYAELDEWNAKIAELIADAEGTSEAQTAAAEARKQADETYAAAHGEASKVVTPEPSPALRKLRNEVMQSVHPDRAVGHADRTLRDRLTQEANDAYSRGDMEALRRILAEYKSSPESVQGTGVAADLERLVLQIKQISRRLAEIEAEAAILTSSEIALLMAKVGVATAKGRNLLAEMAADVRVRVALSREQFEEQLSKSAHP